MESVACYDFLARDSDELGFKQKDIIKVISDPEKVGEKDWFLGELNGKKGMVPKNYIKTPDWFYRGLSRAEAECLLMNRQPDGAFIVRESESSLGDFSLSVKFGQSVQHFKILVDGQGLYFLWRVKFKSVNSLVAHFRQASVSQPELPDEIFLKDMVKRKDAPNTSPKKNFSKAIVLKPPVEKAPQETDFLFQVIALYDFEPQDETELKLRKDDVIDVLDNSDQNWWLGRHRVKKGLFPKSYIREMK